MLGDRRESDRPSVGGVATANMELENTGFDIPEVFGTGSPEAQQLAADTDPYKDPETADYVGLAVHCARGSAVCADAQAVKYGQATPTHTAVPDLLPDEPGRYNGYSALFGARYISPVLGSGTPDLTHNGYQVTNAKGNLVDLNGNEIDGAYLTDYPGFPGFDTINASQTLAYMADMLEPGVPVVYGYIADLHGNEDIPALSSECSGAPDALGSGSACYIAQAQYYNQAFGTFFQRLATDGITPANTLFLFSSDEGDHEAGANVGRALEPTPAGCDGATINGDTVAPDVVCTYTKTDFGELAADVTGLLAQETANTTPFTLEDDTAPEFYVTGDPAAGSAGVRGLEHAVAGLWAANPYSGNSHEQITNYLADPTEEALLHIENADPARTPTFAMFAKPDYYVQTGSAGCSNVTGNSSKDDYIEDGRVITQVLSQPAPNGLNEPEATALGDCYKQLNSSVGELGTATLEASTDAIESTSPGDISYLAVDQDLAQLDKARDHLANQIKDQLWAAEFGRGHLDGYQVNAETQACWGLIGYADHLGVAGAGTAGAGDLLPPPAGYVADSTN